MSKHHAYPPNPRKVDRVQIRMQMNSVVEESLDRFPTPGVAVGLWYGGEEDFVCRGITNVENPQGVDPETLFLAMSISKIVTAVTLMALVENGQADLDDPVMKYLPELKVSKSEWGPLISLRHLCAHTSGWGSHDFWPTDPEPISRDPTPLASLEDLPMLNPPGRMWSYSDVGFVLIGLAIEAIVGLPYEQVARELVFDPLGMTKSTFDPSVAITHRVAVGHQVVGHRKTVSVVRPWRGPRFTNPAGGLASPVCDLLRFARFHLGEAEGVLNKDSIELMKNPQAPAGEGIDFNGIGWLLRDWGQERWITQHGMGSGQHCLIALEPESGFGLVVMTNGWSHGSKLCHAVMKGLATGLLKSKEPTPTMPPLSRTELSEYVGRYGNGVTECSISLSESKTALSLHGVGPGRASTLTFEWVDKIIGSDGPLAGRRGEFIREPDGSIAWLRIASTLLERREPPPKND